MPFHVDSDPLIAQHCAISYILHSVDTNNIPDAYDAAKFSLDGKTKIVIINDHFQRQLPIIIKSNIDKVAHISCTENRILVYNSKPLNISSCPVLVTSANGNNGLYHDKKETN